jgi:hypothetical protein
MFPVIDHLALNISGQLHLKLVTQVSFPPAFLHLLLVYLVCSFQFPATCFLAQQSGPLFKISENRPAGFMIKFAVSSAELKYRLQIATFLCFIYILGGIGFGLQLLCGLCNVSYERNTVDKVDAKNPSRSSR